MSTADNIKQSAQQRVEVLQLLDCLKLENWMERQLDWHIMVPKSRLKSE